MQNLVVWIGSWWFVVIPGSGHCVSHRTVMADSSPCLGFFIRILGFQPDVVKPMGGRTQWDLLWHTAWVPALPWGGDIRFPLQGVIGTVYRRLQEGRVRLKEVTGLGGWLTQPSPAFRGVDPAWRRLFIPPLARSCFLYDLHLNKQIRNVICSQAENLPKFPRELVIH